MVKKVKSRYWRMTHKFGIRLPHSVEEALRIDEEMGTDFWQWALNKEMAKVKAAGASWRATLVQLLWELGYESTKAVSRGGKAASCVSLTHSSLVTLPSV